MSLIKLSSSELRTLLERKEVFLIRKFRKVGKVRIYCNGNRVGIGLLEIVGNIFHDGEDWVVQCNGKTVNLRRFTNLSGYESLEDWLKDARRKNGSIGQSKLYKLTILRLYLTTTA